MKILSTKQQYEAINNINIIKNAILSDNEIQILNSIENLAELTYIIGGMKELNAYLNRLEEDVKYLREQLKNIKAESEK